MAGLSSSESSSWESEVKPLAEFPVSHRKHKKTLLKKIKDWFSAQFAALSLLFKQWVLRIDLPNYHKVTPFFFRAGQPTKKGLQKLIKNGVKTVINLRLKNSDKHGISSDLKYVHYQLSHSETPSLEMIVEFLRIATNPKNHPIFIHCLYGADRTGMFCAIYRIAVQNWPKETAIKEMTDGGFGFHWWIPGLCEFIEGLDIQEIKKQI